MEKFIFGKEKFIKWQFFIVFFFTIPCLFYFFVVAGLVPLANIVIIALFDPITFLFSLLYIFLYGAIYYLISKCLSKISCLIENFYLRAIIVNILISFLIIYLSTHKVYYEISHHGSSPETFLEFWGIKKVYQKVFPTLHQAIEKNDSLRISKIVKQNKFYNDLDEEGRTPLLHAIEKRNIDGFKIIWNSWKGYYSLYEKTYFFLKAEHLQITAIALVLKNEGVITKKTSFLLPIAARKKDFEMISLLLLYGINPNSVDGEDKTALMHLIDHWRRSSWVDKGERQLIAMYDLLQKGTDINSLNKKEYKIPSEILLVVTAVGDKKILEKLIEHDCDVNIKYAHVFDLATPLMIAMKNGYGDIVDLLLNNGAALNLVDRRVNNSRIYTIDNKAPNCLRALEQERKQLDEYRRKTKKIKKTNIYVD